MTSRSSLSRSEPNAQEHKEHKEHNVLQNTDELNISNIYQFQNRSLSDEYDQNTPVDQIAQDHHSHLN